MNLVVHNRETGLATMAHEALRVTGRSAAITYDEQRLARDARVGRGAPAVRPSQAV